MPSIVQQVPTPGQRGSADAQGPKYLDTKTSTTPGRVVARIATGSLGLDHAFEHDADLHKTEVLDAVTHQPIWEISGECAEVDRVVQQIMGS